MVAGQDPTTLIQSKVSALSAAGQASFYALSYAKPNTSETHIPFEIFQTNAISAGKAGTGLFPRTARLNHGCSKAFGAVYSWREEEGVLVVHAIRDIKKGKVSGGGAGCWWEVIERGVGNIDDVYGYEALEVGSAVSPLGVCLTGWFLCLVLRSYLREIYHFDCACEVCSLPPNESAASDRRLNTILDLKKLFSM